jgi:hypothetical protein
MWEEEIAILFEIAVIWFQIFIARRFCMKRPSDDDVIAKKHELQKNIIKINIAFNVLKLFELSECEVKYYFEDKHIFSIEL